MNPCLPPGITSSEPVVNHNDEKKYCCTWSAKACCLGWKPFPPPPQLSSHQTTPRWRGNAALQKQRGWPSDRTNPRRRICTRSMTLFLTRSHHLGCLTNSRILDLSCNALSGSPSKPAHLQPAPPLGLLSLLPAHELRADVKLLAHHPIIVTPSRDTTRPRPRSAACLALRLVFQIL